MRKAGCDLQEHNKCGSRNLSQVRNAAWDSFSVSSYYYNINRCPAGPALTAVHHRCSRFREMPYYSVYSV